MKHPSDKKLPDKAIDLIDVACSRFNLLEEGTERTIGAEQIPLELSKIVKMSEEQIAEKENDNLKNLKTILRKVYMDKMKQLKVLLIKYLLHKQDLKMQINHSVVLCLWDPQA